ncbi:MAG: hypothetical protein WBV90_00055 [Terrimicrobiaceae bacterium]
MSHSGLAPSTVRTYRHEVRYFVRWLEERTATPITRYPSSHSLASSHPALGLFHAGPLLLLEIMVDFVALRGLPSAHFGKELHRAELVGEFDLAALRVVGLRQPVIDGHFSDGGFQNLHQVLNRLIAKNR